MSIVAHLKYAKYVLVHKGYILWVGLRLGWLPLWRLLVHDLSKFSRAEWFPYVDQFYGSGAAKVAAQRAASPTGYRYQPGDNPAFDAAVLHHYHHNDHHAEYWLATNPAIADWVAFMGEPLAERLPMPERCLKEMCIDWCAAGFAQGKPDVRAWYEVRRPTVPISEPQHHRVRQLLQEIADAGIIP